jgi:hypothetical protein
MYPLSFLLPRLSRHHLFSPSCVPDNNRSRTIHLLLMTCPSALSSLPALIFCIHPMAYVLSLVPLNTTQPWACPECNLPRHRLWWGWCLWTVYLGEQSTSFYNDNNQDQQHHDYHHHFLFPSDLSVLSVPLNLCFPISTTSSALPNHTEPVGPQGVAATTNNLPPTLGLQSGEAFLLPDQYERGQFALRTSTVPSCECTTCVGPVHVTSSIRSFAN